MARDFKQTDPSRLDDIYRETGDMIYNWNWVADKEKENGNL